MRARRGDFGNDANVNGTCTPLDERPYRRCVLDRSMKERRIVGRFQRTNPLSQSPRATPETAQRNQSLAGMR